MRRGLEAGVQNSQLYLREVRFGSKADIEARLPDVHYSPKSGHQNFRERGRMVWSPR